LYIWNPESNIYSNTVQVKPDKEISNYSCKIVGYGCEATCKYQVNVEGITGTIYIPNAFTPNGNGNNDVFQVFGKNIKLVRLQIFNRWGEKVFDTPDIALGWDGTYKGTPQPAGIYAYQLTYFSGIETTARETKGSITLIR
jgi:gliding motility-associated-like protein